MTTALVPIALNGLSRLLQIWSRSLYLSQDHCVCLITVTCVVEMSYAMGSVQYMPSKKRVKMQA